MDDLLIEIDNIDYKATARNVKEFLDKKLPRILRIANASPASLASPVISDMPVNRGGAITAKRRWSSTLLPKQSSMGYHERLRIVLRCHPTSSRHDTCKVFRTGKSLIQCTVNAQRTISCETRHTTSSPTVWNCSRVVRICTCIKIRRLLDDCETNTGHILDA